MAGSIKCAFCGLVNWADAHACKRCGKPPQGEQNPVERQAEEPHSSQLSDQHPPPPFRNPPSQPQPSWLQPGVGTPYGSPYAQNENARKGMAIASLVVGIISLFTFGLLFVGAVVGLVLGIVALARISREPHVYAGKELAIGGIATSALSLVMVVPLGIIAAIAIPNLMASRRAANEAYAIRSLREISTAQHTYYETVGGGTYGHLDDLVAAGLLTPTLVDGEEAGYHFIVRANSDYYEVAATPITYRGSGVRSFLVSGGWIHGADKGGLEADTTDPRID